MSTTVKNKQRYVKRVRNGSGLALDIRTYRLFNKDHITDTEINNLVKDIIESDKKSVGK